MAEKKAKTSGNSSKVVKTLRCESCSSTDIDFESGKYGICRNCGAKITVLDNNQKSGREKSVNDDFI